MVRTGATFADAATEYVGYIGEDRVRKASTVEDYRSIINTHLLPAFGELRLGEVSVEEVEAFQSRLGQRVHKGKPITPRTHDKILNVLHGIFKRDQPRTTFDEPGAKSVGTAAQPFLAALTRRGALA
jgi:hypothetical protein